MKFIVFLVVAPYSFVVGYQRFGWPCYLHLQSWKMDNQKTTNS